VGVGVGWGGRWLTDEDRIGARHHGHFFIIKFRGLCWYSHLPISPAPTSVFLILRWGLDLFFGRNPDPGGGMFREPGAGSCRRKTRGAPEKNATGESGIDLGCVVFWKLEVPTSLPPPFCSSFLCVFGSSLVSKKGATKKNAKSPCRKKLRKIKTQCLLPHRFF
jgi:hypothetical protein